MQSANIILSILEKQSKEEENYCFKRLYRNLFNQYFYEETYDKLYAKKSIVNEEINGFFIEEIEKTIELFKEEKYYPENLNNSDVTSIMDKVVLEILNQILQSIYEPIFNENSHWNMPNKNYKTALYQIKATCNGKEWAQKQCIPDILTNIDQDILLEILAKKIYDGRFIEIIRRFLQNGYMEFLPILVNIYLNQLDTYMDSLLLLYKDVSFIRHKSTWLVFASSKYISNEISDKARDFLESDLKISIEENYEIVNLRDKNIMFLDYEISVSTLNSGSSSIELLIPREVIKKYLNPFIRLGEPIHCSKRVNLHVIDIIKEYNNEIEKLYDFYSLANDRSIKMHRFKYYHYYSLAKTIATKEKISVKRVIAKYGIDVPLKNGTGTRKLIGIKYQTKDGEKILTYFNGNSPKVNSLGSE